MACKHSVASHFTKQGKWAGCSAVPPGTMFALVPLPAKRASIQRAPRSVTNVATAAVDALDDLAGLPDVDPTEAPPRPVRTAYRVRYFVADGVDPDTAPLGDDFSRMRFKTLAAVHVKGPDGTLSRDILKRTRLKHGQAQRALSWLVENGLVSKRPDTKR